jgi:hypothetical protein
MSDPLAAVGRLLGRQLGALLHPSTDLRFFTSPLTTAIRIYSLPFVKPFCKLPIARRFMCQQQLLLLLHNCTFGCLVGCDCNFSGTDLALRSAFQTLILSV